MNIKVTDAHVQQATEWYEEHFGIYMNEWINEQIMLELAESSRKLLQKRRPGDEIPKPDVLFFDPNEERARSLRERDMAGLIARSRVRVIANHARGFAEIEVRAQERRRLEDLEHTCPVCDEVRPDRSILRSLEGHTENQRTLDSCWACFVASQEALKAEFLTPERASAVRRYLAAI